MRIYIIRHGESETNREGRWTGWLDAVLTEEGREDAALAGEFLSKISFDKVYASDLIRARTTAEIALPGCEYQTSPLLREICMGNIEGKPKDVITEEDRKNIPTQGYASFGGETSGAFAARITAFMRELEDMNCENVAIFSHGGWLRTFLDLVVGTRLPRKNVCCKNCTVAIFEYSKATWSLHSWINLK